MEKLILDYIRNEYLDDDDDDDDLELTADTPLISSGIVDSFSMVSLKRFLEHKYEIALTDDEASPNAFDTVRKIVAVVERKKSS